MALQQYGRARRMLKIIAAADAVGEQITYLSVATRLQLSPPKDHCRPIAHVGNLLDAAACLAGVPLLALVKVRDQYGDVNPRAFHEFPKERRDAIINRSLKHHFSSLDYAKIAASLNDLGDRGDTRAWQYLEHEVYPGELFFKKLMGEYVDIAMDAINDIGTDIPEKYRTEGWWYARDPRVRDAVLERAKGKCEFCGALGFLKSNGTRYLEAHHVIALANEGKDKLTNVIALCANDHREAHFEMRREDMEAEMIRKLRLLCG